MTIDKFLDGINSSYSDHNYSSLFYYLVLNKKPKSIVEMGILDGYSLFSFAKACHDIGDGKILAIDLFDDYPYNKADFDKLNEYIKKFNLENIVTLHKGDAMNLNVEFHDESIDIMHIDISNTGDKLNHLLKKYHRKLTLDGLLIFEGGSEERDNIEWMKKYNCEPISPIINNEELKTMYNFFVINNYPSITLCFKK